ncbi:MAG: AAA family ATPase [Desulfobacterales bacterium]
MYNSFFGFREKPFKLVPNPDYLYLSKSHEEALAHLRYAVYQGEGFVEITGEVGTGKTILCRAFLEDMAPEVETAYIINPRLSARGLLRAINSEFGIRSDHATAKELIDELNSFLIKKRTEGKRAILIIDEAQNLGRDVLEQLRLLSNLETTREKLLQMILVGQPELSQMLDTRELRQLSQRISLSCSISPLVFSETIQYINHRIHVASPGPRVYFTKGALRRIYRYSGGVPRLINIACDRALLLAFSRGLHRISGGTAKSAIAELSARTRMQAAWKKASPLPLMTFGILAAAFIMTLFFQLEMVKVADVSGFILGSGKKAEAPPVQSKQTVELSFDEPDMPDKTAEALFWNPGDDSLPAAVSHVISLWRNEVNMPDREGKTVEDYIGQAAENHGLEVYEAEKDLSLIRNLDLPAVFCFEHPATLSRVYLAAPATEDEQILFYDPETGKYKGVSREYAGGFWTGRAYVLWENPREIEGVIGRDADGDSVAGLQILLKAAGGGDVEVTGAYDEATRTAIKKIQAGHGIPVDGLADAPEKIVLYRLSGLADEPGIN